MNRFLTGFIAFIVFGFAIILPQQGWASCGCASCPIDTHTQEKSEKGVIRLDYSFQYIDQDTPRAGRDKVEVGAIEGEHNEIYSVNRVHTLAVDAGVTSRLNLQLIVPFVNRAHQHLHVADDELETWNFSGLGDMSLVSRYAWLKPEEESRPTVSSIFGVKLPTGKRHEKNDEGEEAEVGIQPGSGAYSLIVGASSLQMFSVPTLNGAHAQLPFFMSTTYQMNDEGTDDYTMGNEWLTNVGAVYPLLPKLGFSTQINLRVRASDSAHAHDGDTEMEDHAKRTGGTFVYLTPGLQLSFTDNVWSYVNVQLPVYQRVNIIQLTSDANYQAGLSYRFQAF